MFGQASHGYGSKILRIFDISLSSLDEHVDIL